MHYIDTGGWKADRDFTILGAGTLRPATGSPTVAPARKVEREITEEIFNG